MGSAALFLLLVGVLAWRLRAQWRRQILLTAALPILLVGGVGGTLYHGLRSERVYLYMDFMPILILLLMCTIYFWRQVLTRRRYILTALLPFIVLEAIIGYFINRAETQQARVIAINLSYANLGLMALVPIVWLQLRTRWLHWNRIGWALICFGLALLNRYLDNVRPPLLPMGTHFLWHTFGTAATYFLIDYIYLYVDWKKANKLVAPLPELV